MDGGQHRSRLLRTRGKLLSVGFAFTEPGNKEVTFLQAMPFISPNSNGASGRIASNSCGGAKAEIIAVCLR